MAKEYVEREAVLSAIFKTSAILKVFFPEMFDAIKAIQAADVRPVVRGRWITRPYMMGNTYYCSLCGENYGRKHKFCPNCGAKMEVGC